MEPKKFFVKDFIQYASPCFACNGTPRLRVSFRQKGDLPGSISYQGTITPVVTDNHIEIDMSVKYGSHVKVWILPKTNKYVTNDDAGFSQQIAKRTLHLFTECSCGTIFESNDLDFQTFNKVIGATTIRHEYITFQEKSTRYILDSDFIQGKTKATVAKINQSQTTIQTKTGSMGQVLLPIPSQLEFNLPLLPKYKVRNKQYLIDKLKIYTIFS